MRIRRVISLVMAVLFSFGCFFGAFAEEPTKKELLKRISVLEKQVSDLKSMFTEMQSKQATVSQKVETIKKESESIAKAVQTEGKPISGQFLTSKHKIKMYGFLKLDASLDDSRTDNPDAPRYALSEATTESESQFAMTAMNTRIGLKYDGPQLAEANVVGNVELDFYDTSTDNSQRLRMRHAFVELQYPKWAVLAGQTWDVFGPLGPNSLNTNGYLWNGGNIGFRRAQVRLTNYFDVNSNKKIITQFSVNRNIGSTDGFGTGSNSGENSGVPLLEGRVAYKFPLLKETATVGVSGIYGNEEYNRTSTTESSYDIPQWAYGLDLAVPLNSKLSLKGEFFSGSNLDAFLAGIGQGINTTTEKGIDTIGGWAQLSYKASAKHSFNLGYGIDNPSNEDLNSGNRSKNEVIFMNLIYDLYKGVQLGFEYSHFQTEYINASKGTNDRVTTSLIYKF